MQRNHLLVAIATAATLAVPATALPAASAEIKGQPKGEKHVLREYAADTWRSMAAMADPGTGLVSDNVGGDLAAAGRAAYTSPTNIGAYMWSAVAAREIGLISAAETRQRIAQTLGTLATLEIHEPSGMYYNWYDPATGAKLTVWPVDGGVVNPFLSSVDNAWLATAFEVVKDQVPELAADADALLQRMDFGYYYNPVENQIRGGFWVEPVPGSIPGNYRGGATVYYTGHHYGAFNTEPRMASYLGIASGQIPQRHYFGTFRTFPGDNCDWSWTEQKATGEWQEYLGVRVYEGAYDYRGMRLIPTWGGSMFEALMVPLFVPEEEWGTRSWAITHPTYVQAQIEHGMNEAGYGYWGFSPSNNPAGGYREYGVDQIGMNPDGYTSDQERTTVDAGYGDCRPAQPMPTSYGQGVVTPHASFLALRYDRKAALANLANLRADFGAYGPGGFYDAINVSTGQMSERHLSLDQGMVMAALGNELADDVMRSAFVTGDMATRVEPLMRMEEFAGLVGGRRR
ncbi:MAG: glucoamylase family protein [Mycobacteriales bacterium]